MITELSSIYSSVNHNVGPYYTQDNIPNITRTVAQHIFTSDVRTQINTILEEPESIEYTEQDYQYQELMGFMPEKKSRKPSLIRTLIEKKLKAVCSLDSSVAIPIIQKGESFRIFEKMVETTSETKDVLEWIREDNADKTGSNKYRVRKVTYTRNQNYESSQGNWISSDWANEPNYWTNEIRKGLRDFSDHMQQIFPNCGIVLITEGGVQKGTVTPGTDIDTYCYIYGNKNEFGKIQNEINKVYAEMIGKLPFKIKEGEQLRPRYFDVETATTYWQRDSGEFVEDTDGDLQSDSITFTVRQNEHGVLLIAEGQEKMFQKPPELVKKDWYIKIGTKSQNILESSDHKFSQESARDELKSFRDEVW